MAGKSREINASNYSLVIVINAFFKFIQELLMNKH